MSVVRTKEGVQFAVIAPGGFRILGALDLVTRRYGFSLDLVITSGTDGEHSGPDDPHHHGEAYDVRSHDFPAELKQEFVAAVLSILNEDGDRFFGFLEAPGTENEHFHFQVKKGTVYP